MAGFGSSADFGGLRRFFNFYHDHDFHYVHHHHSDGIQQRAGRGCKRHVDGHRFALRGYRNGYVL
jgi:hypothetical protein